MSIKSIIKKLDGKCKKISNISACLSVIFAMVALFVSCEAYNLSTKGADFSLMISKIQESIDLKEDGQYSDLEGWKSFDNKGRSLFLEKDKNSQPDETYYKIDDSDCTYLCLSISNNGVMASKNVFIKVDFENAYLIPKEGYDTVWQMEKIPGANYNDSLGLRYEYGENVLLYPNDVRDLYIDLLNNYEMWVDEKGGKINISIVGDNSTLKKQSFDIKIDK